MIVIHQEEEDHQPTVRKKTRQRPRVHRLRRDSWLDDHANLLIASPSLLLADLAITSILLHSSEEPTKVQCITLNHNPLLLLLAKAVPQELAILEIEGIRVGGGSVDDLGLGGEGEGIAVDGFGGEGGGGAGTAHSYALEHPSWQHGVFSSPWREGGNGGRRLGCGSWSKTQHGFWGEIWWGVGSVQFALVFWKLEPKPNRFFSVQIFPKPTPN